MKILIVSQYFWPENFRINDLSSELVKRGHEVVVLTGKPNYPAGVVFQGYLEAPDDFLDYHGCKVLRVPMITRGHGAIKLMLNYISYVVSASILGSFRLRKSHFDIIFVYEPSPVTVCLPAIFIKFFKKIPVVFWVQDLWPETLEAVGVVKSPMILRLVGYMVHYIYNRCDLILGQSKAFYDGIAKYCNEKSKIRYFPNWSEDFFTGMTDDATNANAIAQCSNTFNILFAGNMGEAQDFPAILHAAEILQANHIRAKIFIVGDGRMYGWVKNEITRLGLEDYVHLLGRHPLETMPKFYASADVLLATLKNSPVFAKTIPSKVQSYMAAGKPLLTMISGEGSRVVGESKSGYTADSGDYKQLAKNIIQMSLLSGEDLSIFGENARSYAKREFDRDKLITQLEIWFNEVAF